MDITSTSANSDVDEREADTAEARVLPSPAVLRQVARRTLIATWMVALLLLMTLLMTTYAIG